MKHSCGRGYFELLYFLAPGNKKIDTMLFIQGGTEHRY